MKLLIVSDLHLEFILGDGSVVLDRLAPADILVVAGDLTTQRRMRGTFEEVCKRFKHVVYVPGNHEYYGSTYEGVQASLAKAAKAHKNLRVLQNQFTTIEGRRFVGTTLWFPYKGRCIEEYQLADFQVSGFRDWVGEENTRATEFLARNVTDGDIVITHHVPSRRSVAERFKCDALNKFFLCPMEGLLEERRPKLWVHGHTHDSFDYAQGDTRVICNPYGYWQVDENPKFNPGLVVEV